MPLGPYARKSASWPSARPRPPDSTATAMPRSRCGGAAPSTMERPPHWALRRRKPRIMAVRSRRAVACGRLRFCTECWTSLPLLRYSVIGRSSGAPQGIIASLPQSCALPSGTAAQVVRSYNPLVADGSLFACLPPTRCAPRPFILLSGRRTHALHASYLLDRQGARVTHPSDSAQKKIGRSMAWVRG